MKLSSGKIIITAMAATLLAALALGAIALRHTRHEDEFRDQELRSLLQSECRLLAERCRRELEGIRTNLEAKAARVKPHPNSLREVIDREPFFVEGFIANRSGTLFYPVNENTWVYRYHELFSGLVSAQFPESNIYSYQNQGNYGNILFHDGNVQGPDDSSWYTPKAKGSSVKDEAPEKPKSIYPLSRRSKSDTSIMTARKAVAAAKEEKNNRAVAAETAAAPAAPPPVQAVVSPHKEELRLNADADNKPDKRMISRFEALTRDRKQGFIPWLSDNRHTPLVWAESAESADTIIGFEVESIVIWSRLLPLFPDSLPPYFRIELVNAANRVVYAAGGDVPEGTELDPVLLIPVSDELLPNAQLRASLIPAYMPARGTRLGIWMAISALVLITVTAGMAALWLLRRELQLAGQKSNFVSQVSHELKTPLTSIRMYSELLHEHGPKLPEDRQARYLQVLVDETERLTRLVNNVLDFSRLDNGRRRYNLARTDLRELLESLVPLCGESLAAAGLKLNLILPEGPACCVIDRDSLLQVIFNLIDNAAKYAPESGKLDIELTRNDKHWEIHIRDYGPGITRGSAEKLFQKFYRVNTELNSKTSGFGLGLSISRGLLRDQGGDLKFVHASPGAGFIIILPEEHA